MTCPTLVATVPSRDRLDTLVIPVPAGERAWLEFGASLVEMHTEQEAARDREGLTGVERDRIGFAAKGLEIAVEVWNDVTAGFRGQDIAWARFATLVAAEKSGRRDLMQAGMELALTRMQGAHEEYLAKTTR